MSKNKWAGSALVLAAALLGATAFAQDAALKHSARAFDFATLDTDKDGRVTKVEVDAFRSGKVKAMDANADGKLSAEEMAASRIADVTARINARSVEMVKRMDTDGDGLLTAAEMAVRPGPEKLFDRIDADKDGAVTEAEVDGAMKAMHEKHGKGERGHSKHRPWMGDNRGGADGMGVPDGMSGPDAEPDEGDDQAN